MSFFNSNRSHFHITIYDTFPIWAIFNWLLDCCNNVSSYPHWQVNKLSRAVKNLRSDDWLVLSDPIFSFCSSPFRSEFLNFYIFVTRSVLIINISFGTVPSGIKISEKRPWPRSWVIFRKHVFIPFSITDQQVLKLGINTWLQKITHDLGQCRFFNTR